MKRKPLTRKTPLKRTPLKGQQPRMVRPSRKNKRPHFNKNLRKPYKDAKGNQCELWDLLNESKWDEWLKARDESQRYTVELHHIIHNSVQVYDYVENYICLASCVHKPFVHRFSIEGPIACWAIKYRTLSLDVPRLHEVTNFNVISWLSLHPSSVPYFEDLRLETLEGASKLFPSFVWGE